MFARLLVGLDGSPGAEAALESAIALGRRFHSTIVLTAIVDVNVLEAPLMESAGSGWPDGMLGAPASIELGDVLRARAERLVEVAAARVTAQHLTVEAVYRVGVVEEELLSVADDVEALVIGRRGDLSGPAAIGEHTMKLIRRSPHPVVVAGEHPSQFARLVVAYDGGETSSAALALAGRYAGAAQVSLDIVHVSDDAAAGEALLARAGAFLSREAVAYETHRLASDVVTALAGHVERTGADVLVCGAHGSRRRSWSMGSHAEKLLRATSIPLIIVR